MHLKRYIDSRAAATRIARVFGKFRLGTSQSYDSLRLDYPNGFIEFRRNPSGFLSIAAGAPNGSVLVHCVLETITELKADRKKRSVRLTCDAPRGRRTTIFVGSLIDPEHGFFDIQLNRNDIPLPRPPLAHWRPRQRRPTK